MPCCPSLSLKGKDVNGSVHWQPMKEGIENLLQAENTAILHCLYNLQTIEDISDYS